MLSVVKKPCHLVTSFSTTSSLSWQAQGLQREHCARARLDAAGKHSRTDSLQAGKERLAEEKPLLRPNADGKAEGSEDHKAGQQVDSFHSCLYYFNIGCVCQTSSKKLLQRPCSALDTDVPRGRSCPTSPEGMVAPGFAEAPGGPSLMCELSCSRLGWEVQQTGNV